MKKNSVIGIFLALALALTACGSAQRSNTFTNTPLTPEAKLALGILKLEGTTQAVDAKQAAQLLPLWQLLRQLNSSSSAAPEEVSAVVDAIQAAMTPGQVSAIDGFQLTQRDIFQTLQEMGAAGGGFTGSGGNSSGTPSAAGQNGNNTTRRNGGGGNFPGGGGFIPGGGGNVPVGGFGPGGATNGNSNTSSAQAQQIRQNASATLLITEVIKVLSGKIKS